MENHYLVCGELVYYTFSPGWTAATAQQPMWVVSQVQHGQAQRLPSPSVPGGNLPPNSDALRPLLPLIFLSFSLFPFLLQSPSFFQWHSQKLYFDLVLFPLFFPFYFCSSLFFLVLFLPFPIYFSFPSFSLEDL